MKRISTVHHLTHKIPSTGQDPKRHCGYRCGSISVIQHDKFIQVQKNHYFQRHQTAYTQLAVVLTPSGDTVIPLAIIAHIDTFHKQMKAVHLHDDREKTLRFIRTYIQDLNLEITQWNQSHDTQVAVNATILFVYGQSLILFNFGHNTVMLYRDGSLTEYNGLNIDENQHYSIKRGLDGKMEYQFINSVIPPLGKADFSEQQLAQLFSQSFRILTNDLYIIVGEDAVDIDQFNMDVHIYEHAIDDKEMHKVLLHNAHPTTDRGSLWMITAIARVQLQSYVFSTYLLRRVKGWLTILLLLGLFLVPLFTPDPPMDQVTRPNTGFELLENLPDIASSQALLEQMLNRAAFEEDQGIDKQNPNNQEDAPLTYDLAADLPRLSATMAVLIDDPTLPDLATYTVLTPPKPLNAIQLAEYYYGKTNHAWIILQLNGIDDLTYKWPQDAPVYLPVFSASVKHRTYVRDYLGPIYDHDRALEVVLAYNQAQDRAFGNQVLLLPPIEPLDASPPE